MVMDQMNFILLVVLASSAFWICLAARRGILALRKMHAMMLVAFLALSGVVAVIGDKTNGLMRVIGPLWSPPPVVVTVTATDIARGWRVESVITNSTYSYEMPTNAICVGNWHIHGARTSLGNHRVDLGAMGSVSPDEWAFPLGTNFESFTSFWYFVDGRIRPTPRDAAHEIRAAGGPMFAMPGSSRLWAAEDYDGSRVLTWENFFVGNDTNTPVNAQIRLYANGEFTTCSNEVMTICRRVEPFDWDGDGLVNLIDPDPYTNSGDCHGTCAAWYNVACSNILTAVDGDYGVELTWREGVNSNAYYFVSVVAESGPAEIVFGASQAGNLGSPIVVAAGGETNLVPLLVGVEYAVTSSVPISISTPADGFAQVVVDSPSTCRIHWPINFIFTETVGEAMRSGNVTRTYEVTASPFDPGGVFAWNQPGGCHCITYAGSHILMNCLPDCTCGGNCFVSGWFGFEGIFIPVAGGECRCGIQDTACPAVPQTEGPCISVAFSDAAVIFEDSYQESPGVWKQKRSTRTWLTVYANAGPNGGALTLSSQNIGKLSVVEGGVFSLPSPLNLASDETFNAQYLFEGELPSVTTNDISVSGSFLPTGQSQPLQSSAALTSVKVELDAVYAAPENSCASRHTYGVGEKVSFRATPQSASITASVQSYNLNEETNTYYNSFGGVLATNLAVECVYTCPVAACYVPAVTVGCSGAQYCPTMHLVEPAEVVTREATWPGVCWPSGCVGEAGLRTVNYIGPMNVSFKGVAVSEVPCYDVIPATGCFTQGVHHLSHTYDAGAGWVFVVKDGNYWTIDNAGSDAAETNWVEGVASSMTWKIPVGWHRINKEFADIGYWRDRYADYADYQNTNSPALLIGGRTDLYLQERHVDGDGAFRTDKFGHWISRSKSCRIILDGSTIQWWHH